MRSVCPEEELNRQALCDPRAAVANFSVKTSTTLSILVPVYNEEYLVRASLERLKIVGQSPLLDRVEIIVVDDGSTDQTAAVLGEFQLSVTEELSGRLEWLFLRHDANQGKAAAIRTAHIACWATLCRKSSACSRFAET